MLAVQGQQAVFKFGNFLLHLNQSQLLALNALLRIFQNLVRLGSGLAQGLVRLGFGFADHAVAQLLCADQCAAQAVLVLAVLLHLLGKDLNLSFQFFLFGQQLGVLRRHLLQKFLHFVLFVAAHLFVKTSGGNGFRSQHLRVPPLSFSLLPQKGFIIIGSKPLYVSHTYFPSVR